MAERSLQQVQRLRVLLKSEKYDKQQLENGLEDLERTLQQDLLQPQKLASFQTALSDNGNATATPLWNSMDDAWKPRVTIRSVRTVNTLSETQRALLAEVRSEVRNDALLAENFMEASIESNEISKQDDVILRYRDRLPSLEARPVNLRGMRAVYVVSNDPFLDKFNEVMRLSDPYVKQPTVQVISP